MFSATSIDAAAQPPSPIIVPGDPGELEIDKGRWRVLQTLEKYSDDIDAYRAAYGKEMGEAKFFADHLPYESLKQEGNLLLVTGVATIWQWAIGNGVNTTGNALCYLNTANATMGVGDSATAELLNQVDLLASSNKYYQGMDAGYPIVTDVTLPGNTTVKAVTAATNASPIQITSTAHGYSTGQVVYIAGVAGNTAANGLWQITGVDANNFQLNNSTGNGAYTSGGLVTLSDVIVFKVTVGSANANYAWAEWVIKNGTGGNSRAFNRKVSSLGTKASGTWALTTAIALA